VDEIGDGLGYGDVACGNRLSLDGLEGKFNIFLSLLSESNHLISNLLVFPNKDRIIPV
jgi:hypothetical protein